MDPGDYPVYARQILDNFYADYASDSLGSFFNKNDWRQLFPSWSTIDEIAVQKIISKEYETKVLSDGSFVIMKVPNGGLTEENVLFAFAK